MSTTSLPSPGPPTPKKTVYIGSRASNLALVQTNIVRDALIAAHPELNFEIISMTTAGDNNQMKPLHSFGAKALWTEELEVLLLDYRLDMIVHSLKDMPTKLPAGCKIGAILEREDPRDALVMKAGSLHKSLDDLPAGSVVGTSSVRRSAQIAKKYPEMKFADVRGNILTRLSKLDAQDSCYTCLVLASAGLLRLGLDDRITVPITSPVLLHAVGQGALGVEIRDTDTSAAALLAPLCHTPTTLSCTAERSLMRALEGGCSVPIGVETEFVEGPKSIMKMRATVVSLDGKTSVLVEERMSIYSVEDADEFGKVVAQALVREGAGEILKEINLKRNIVDA